MIKEMIICRCSECGDMYDISKVYDELSDDFARLEFVVNEQTCLVCKNKYKPLKNIYKMDDFVYDALRRCKM